jgi:hypothetical protein
MFRSSHKRSMAVVAALVAGVCAAAGPQVSDLPSELVGEFRSAPGESLDDFMVIVGGALHRFSARTQFEACGWIGVSADHSQYGVIAYSNRSHIACNSRGIDVPTDMSPTPYTIHSHPTQTGLQLNKADRIALTLLGNGTVVAGLQRSASAPATVQVVTDGFNLGDYSRTGYLAASGGIWFQNGAGTDRFVGTYQAVQP